MKNYTSGELKEARPEFVLDDNAPKKLKDIFYGSGASILASDRVRFSDLRNNPEYIPFLKGKDIRHFMGWSGEYDEFFNFCGDQDFALDMGVKYGNYVSQLSLKGRDDEDKEAVIAEQIHTAIIYQCYGYNEDMPDYFKNKYPELFLDKNAPDELKELYYPKSNRRTFVYSDFGETKLTFNFLKKKPEYIEFLKDKDLRPILNRRYEAVLDICEGNTERFLQLGLEYGDVLVHQQISDRVDNLGHQLSNIQIDDEVLKNSFDELIGEAIRERTLLAYDDNLPLRLQYKYPDVFLLPEELEKIRSGIVNTWGVDEELGTLKEKFYRRCISFRDLYLNDELKKIIRNKDIDRCMDFYKAGEFFKKFSEVLNGNFDKAYNLSINKYSQQLTSILYGYTASENIDKVLEFYKQAKFIPHQSVVNKLPNEKIKGFALNKNLWRKLMKIEEYNSNSEYIGSLLELAVVMGVFETREFKKNGKIMIQGAGEEGFEKLQELINYVPEYFEVPAIQQTNSKNELYRFAMNGYFKFDNDYLDALRDRKVKIEFSKVGLIDELKEDLLSVYDMMTVVDSSYMDEEEIEEFFRIDSNGKYHYVLDKNSNAKVQKLLKTVGIKNDRWLTQQEYELIKSCNGDFVSKAFIQEGGGYHFNIYKKGNFYVVGDQTSVTEEQSKANKKLFDYVRFLMQEYSMEEGALRLAANNDRSNIDLVLDNEKMNKLLEAADWVSKRASDKYMNSDLYKLNLEKSNGYKFLSSEGLHQLFEGLELEYSKVFRDFVLKNKYELINDYEILDLFKEFQQKIKELSADPDYANIELTPELLIKKLVPNENQYKNKKIGFHKGEELATKFAFNQEYFDYSQQIWSEARKREVSSIPRVKGEENSYSYEVLRLDDAEGIYIGNLTDCCQRLAGAGESSMIHSMTEQNGRVFVIRDDNKRIIAQSWLWRNGNTICFDNVEIPNKAKSFENQKSIYRILLNVSKALCDKDNEALNKLVEAGKISEQKVKELKAAKVTVGRGHNDIERIAYNEDRTLEDTEKKRPIESGNVYKGIFSKEKLYISDSNSQIILYQAEDYVSSDSMLAIHQDENIELSYSEMRYKELKLMKSIIKEVEGKCEFDMREDLLKQYDVAEDEIRLVQGTDWFMLYSEKDEEITVHKMLKSPSSGIMKKSIKEQREAVKMLMDKGKKISMEFENDRAHKAAKSMVKHMQKRYTMKVIDEGDRLSVSEIQTR